jgi:hypothetical protein
MHMSIAGPNALDPARMAPDERFAEIGRILALGLTRLHATKSTDLFANSGDSCLDFSPCPRRHAGTVGKHRA